MDMGFGQFPWDDPRNYKRTHKKKYEIVASMPPVGVSVHNKLELVDYVTSEKERFVLTGTVGEQQVIAVEELADKYTMEDGSPITPQALNSKVKSAIYNGQKVQVIMPFKVLSIPGVTNFAIQVPIGYAFPLQTSYGYILQVNAPGIPHGNGDFIVTSTVIGPNGKEMPNMDDRWVVNGAIFASTHDLHAFPGLVNQNTNRTLQNFAHPEFKGVQLGNNGRGFDVIHDVMRARANEIIAKFSKDGYKATIHKLDDPVATDEFCVMYSICIQNMYDEDNYANVNIGTLSGGLAMSIDCDGDHIESKKTEMNRGNVEGAIRYGGKRLEELGFYKDSQTKSGEDNGLSERIAEFNSWASAINLKAKAQFLRGGYRVSTELTQEPSNLMDGTVAMYTIGIENKYHPDENYAWIWIGVSTDGGLIGTISIDADHIETRNVPFSRENFAKLVANAYSVINRSNFYRD